MDISTEYIDLIGAAERTGLAKHIIRSNARYGNLASTIIGKHRVYRIADLDRFAADHKAGKFPVGVYKGAR
jgi:hypothetical protein